MTCCQLDRAVRVKRNHYSALPHELQHALQDVMERSLLRSILNQESLGISLDQLNQRLQYLTWFGITYSLADMLTGLISPTSCNFHRLRIATIFPLHVLLQTAYGQLLLPKPPSLTCGLLRFFLDLASTAVICRVALAACIYTIWTARNALLVGCVWQSLQFIRGS